MSDKKNEKIEAERHRSDMNVTFAVNSAQAPSRHPEGSA